MFRLSCCLLSLAFAAVAQEGAAPQEIPGVRVELYPQAWATSNVDVELRIMVRADLDAELPAELVSGVKLTVKCDDAARPMVDLPGRGGSVFVTAGTRIDRVAKVPSTAFVGTDPLSSAVRVAIAWPGIAGANATFRVVPATTGLDVARLDLARTQVVLVTSHGDITLQFRPDKAPNHVENFVKLCLQGFYDGTKFHRVMADFMIQGGCPLTKDDSKVAMWGNGGPGYTIDAEFNDLRHLRGALSTARRPTDVNSAGSGFFIVHKDQSHLDGKYTIFGSIAQGLDALDRIAAVPVGGPDNSLPLQPVVLRQAVVLPVLKK